MINNLTLVNLLVQCFGKKIQRKEVKGLCHKELKMKKKEERKKEKKKEE